MNSQTFKMIPDDQELASVERDLTFYPTENSTPQTISTEQISHYNKHGYVAPIDIFNPDEISDIRNQFDALLEQTLAAGGDSYSISSAHLKHGIAYDLLTDSRLIDVVSDLLGENVIGWGSHFFCKMPHDGKAVAWHQDASYWPLSPSKALTVWLAIDDADQQNGCMKFIAGSHQVGHLTYRPSSAAEHNVLNQTIENPEQYGTEVFNELKAGQISMHSDLLLHGSEANQSDRRRCALTLRYASADVTAALGWNEKGVWCKGEDSRGHWSNNHRP